jgi:hypothetical protein
LRASYRQALFEQTCPVAHALLHAPQLLAFVAVFTHVPLHAV